MLTSVGIGAPPIWSPPGIAPQLRPDSGTVYVDQNTDRNPRSPLEPIVRAVTFLHLGFDFEDIDIITDRRPLRKLYAFVAGEIDDFQFAVELIGSTVLFIRTETQTRETIPPGEFRGYRRAFEEEYTKLLPSAKGTTSHHRVSRYNFGGLTFLVRSAVDGFIEEKPKPDEKSGKDNDSDDDLVKYMKAASLRIPTFPNTTASSTLGVRVLEGGQKTPHSTLFELKTQSKFSKTPFQLSRKMPDLWIAQTPMFINAAYQNAHIKWSHRKGGAAAQPRLAEFIDITVMPIQEVLLEWEKESQATLRKLAIVVRQIVNAIRRTEDATTCIVRFRSSEPGILSIEKAGENEVPLISKDLRHHWNIS